MHIAMAMSPDATKYITTGLHLWSYQLHVTHCSPWRNTRNKPPIIVRPKENSAGVWYVRRYGTMVLLRPAVLMMNNCIYSRQAGRQAGSKASSKQLA